MNNNKDLNPALKKEKEKKTFEPNSKPSFIQRLAGGLIDLCIVFLAYWGFYSLILSTPISNSYYSLIDYKTRIEDGYKIQSGIGERIFIDASNEKQYSGSIHYYYDNDSQYVVVLKNEYSDAELDKYIDLMDSSKRLSNANFDTRLINYGFNVLAGGLSTLLFLFVIPLLNKRKTTIGGMFSEQQIISARHEGRARWYQLLIRYLFVFIIDGCFPFLFLELTTFVIFPFLFLVISLLSKSGRTLHCVISQTKIIDKRSYSPMVEDFDLNAKPY